MLISHKYKFIFLKAKKVSGTSTEAFLERYCLSDEDEKKHQHTHHNFETVSEFGIVGARLTEYKKWYHHMPSIEIKDGIGEEIWNSYVKICNIRNPYSLAISYYCREILHEPNPKNFELFLNKEQNIDYLLSNKKIWTLNNEFSYDFYLRQEIIESELKNLLHILNLPFYNLNIPTYNRKMVRPHYSNYYNHNTKKIIETHFGEELEYFKYSFETNS